MEVSDYVDGPLEDTLYRKGKMWVFGKEVKHNDVYIKISKGVKGCGAFCISFHVGGVVCAQEGLVFPGEDFCHFSGD